MSCVILKKFSEYALGVESFVVILRVILSVILHVTLPIILRAESFMFALIIS